MDETTTARETTPTHPETAGRSSVHATGTMPDPPDAGGDPVVPSLRPEVAQLLLTDIETGLITYVLDTSVLLADPLSLTRFAERSEEHASELQSRGHLVCRPLLVNKNRR